MQAKRPPLWQDVLAGAWLLAAIVAYVVYGFPGKLFAPLFR